MSKQKRRQKRRNRRSNKLFPTLADAKRFVDELTASITVMPSVREGEYVYTISNQYLVRHGLDINIFKQCSYIYYETVGQCEPSEIYEPDCSALVRSSLSNQEVEDWWKETFGMEIKVMRRAEFVTEQ